LIGFDLIAALLMKVRRRDAMVEVAHSLIRPTRLSLTLSINGSNDVTRRQLLSSSKFYGADSLSIIMGKRHDAEENEVWNLL
jgi:hypothetical protein